MVDRSAAEPLLPANERFSASPPSPRRQSDADGVMDRTLSAGSDLSVSGPISGLSAAVNELNRLAGPLPVLPGVVQPRTKTISVFYWSDYDTGTKYTYTVEVAAQNFIRDLIQHSIVYFQSKGALHDPRPENYLFRAANKESKPKTHFPAFGLDQKAVDTGMTRFALCHRTMDEKAKRKLVDDSEESQSPGPPAINEPEQTQSSLNPSTVLQPSPKRCWLIRCFLS